MENRIDAFQGTQEQYIYFLEQRVRLCREQHPPGNICSPAPARVIQQQRPPATSHGSATHLNTAQAENDSYLRTYPNSKRKRALAVESSHEPAAVGLKVIRWAPDQRPTSAHNPYWRHLVRTLVKETPDVKAWEELTGQYGVAASTISFLIGDDVATAVIGEASATLSKEAYPITACSDLQRLQQYAETASKRYSQASLTIQLVHFSRFLVLSSCLVCWRQGVPKKDILPVVSTCVGKMVSQRYGEDILRTVGFLNRLIDTLDAHGWKSRASELLLNWNRPITAYVPLTWSPEESLDFLKESLCDKRFEESTDAVARASTAQTAVSYQRMTLFVPSLVHSMTGKNVHVARISHILGYKFAGLLADEYVNPIRFFNRG